MVIFGKVWYNKEDKPRPAGGGKEGRKMPHYILYLFAGIILAVFSEKIDDLTGNRPFVRRLLSTLCLLLVLMGTIGGFIVKIFA